MVGSVGCSWFWLGFVSKNHYPRFTGAPPHPLHDALHTPSFGGFGLSVGLAFLTVARSIPACAGEPVCVAVNAAKWQVYPRVFGVGLVAVDGSIPACAGEPT